ncbi:hypothetical protein CPB86DRAFT_869016 [Serendipita vermifera]|nr:hypothetical protein CPB86DRAFT_869016 [Serendipita vermifera]
MSMISRAGSSARLQAVKPQSYRQLQLSQVGRRFASSNPPKSNETIEKAGEYAKKAYEQGSAVAGKAFERGSAIAGKALEGAKKYAGPYGQQVQGSLGGYREPIMYNLSVLKEVFKQVYIRESLAPPKSLSQITQAYRSLWERGSSVQWWRNALESGEWKRVGIYALEAYGIFHIGEMVGRRSIVGYDLK